MHRVFSISSFNQSNHYNLFYRPDSSIISSSVFKATEKVGSPCYPFHKLGALISPLMFHWYLHIPFYPATELFLNGFEFWLSPSHSSRFAFPAGEAGCTQQWKRERFFFFLIYAATEEICREEVQRLTSSDTKYWSKLQSHIWPQPKAHLFLDDTGKLCPNTLPFG